MNINQLLAFESQKPRLRGPDALNDEHLTINPSLPSKPRLKHMPRKREEKREEGRVDSGSGDLDIDLCPPFPQAEPLAARRKYVQFKGI